MNKSPKKTLFFVFVVVLVAIGILILTRQKTDGGIDGNLDEFAKCLAGKGITMYGAEWCAHCQNEKRAFGDSFKFVPYVECPDEPQKCIDVGIEGYPTWIFPDGRKLIGEQGIEKLSQESGCALP